MLADIVYMNLGRIALAEGAKWNMNSHDVEDGLQNACVRILSENIENYGSQLNALRNALASIRVVNGRERDRRELYFEE